MQPSTGTLLPPIQPRVRPDARAHVARARGEQPARLGRHGAGRDRYDRVLVPLQHELRVPRAGVPELHAAVLGAREDPLRVGGQGDAEDKVLWKSHCQ